MLKQYDPILKKYKYLFQLLISITMVRVFFLYVSLARKKFGMNKL